MLIKCNSCNKEISAFAESCPACGGPNKWIHPKINEFLEKKDRTGISRPFTFEWNKTEIWGRTKPQLTIIGWGVLFIIIFLVITAFIVYGFWGAVIGGAIAGFYKVAAENSSKIEIFKADLQEKKWESSNDKFWDPVRKTLEL